MPVPLSDRTARWRAALAGQAPVTGMWVASGSPVCAEICAGAGFDWLLGRQRARAERPAVDPGAAPGGGRVPGDAGYQATER